MTISGIYHHDLILIWHTLAMDSSLYNFAISLIDPKMRLVAGRRLLGGVSADVFLLQVKDHQGYRAQWVLRQNKKADTQTAASIAISREYELAHALYRQGFCVPEPLAVCLDTTEFGEPFWVMAFISGSTDLGDGDLRARLEAMAEALVQIHKAPISALKKLPNRTNPIPELYDYLPSGALWSQLRRLLSDNRFCEYSGTPSLLHGDFWAGNLIWDQDQLVGILDWEDAAIGDPMCDLATARLEILWKFDDATAQQFTKHYAQRLPIDRWRLALWQVFVGSAALKFMGDWGLDAKVVNRMERCSKTFIESSAQQVVTMDPETEPSTQLPAF